MTERGGFERLRKRRLDYVKAARENDFEEGLKSLLSEPYPDNAHFIYELLQNAEDALATTVEFSLGRENLTVSHDGKRPFTLHDIESITGIGRSTKKDDPTQIGKFGVGFKAVFAYTTRPEVRSGEHAFAIVDLFVPEEILGDGKPGWTTFTFPFNRRDKPATIACDEVERGLSELDETTLLFLNRINTITYELPDGAIGIIEREQVDERVIRITKTAGDGFVESHWLRIVGPASVGHEGETPLSVAVAFRLEPHETVRTRSDSRSDDGSPPHKRWSVSPLKDGDVSIYFPAVKESSGLRFHIHAPFASTVARDSVRDDPGNLRLVMDIAAAIVDQLPRLCADGLIDDKLLATLPNEDDAIGHPYTLIRDAITEAFNDLPITPVRGAGNEYAAARTLVSSPSEFRNWLEPADLPALFRIAKKPTGHVPRWVRDRDGRAGKFLSGLDTIQFGWKELNTVLVHTTVFTSGAAVETRLYSRDEGPLGSLIAALRSSQFPSDDWLAWLEGKSDESLVDLYRLIGRGSGGRLLSANLMAIPMIRLQQNERTRHVKGSETFLPSSKSDAVQSRVPPDLAYFDDEINARAHDLKVFYSAAGVKRWDDNAKLEVRLRRYPQANLQNRPIPDGDGAAPHLDDVREFVRHGLANQDDARAKFGDIPFLLASQSDGTLRWVTPKETFLDTPFRETGFSALFPRVKLYWKASGDYAYDQKPYPLQGLYLEINGIERFLELAGAMADIEISSADAKNNPQFDRWWKASNNENSHGARVDWQIANLDEILKIGDPTLLRLLWHCVVKAPGSKASASYQANRSALQHPMTSQLAQTLKTTAWVQDRDGHVKLPREMTVDELPPGWQRPGPTSLVHKLDFGAEAARRDQKREGVSQFLREEGLDEGGIELLREAKELGVPIEDLLGMLRQRSVADRFPGGASDDPNRRASIAALDALEAPQHTTEIRERRIIVGQNLATAESKAYLRGHYQSPDGDMHCQACRQVLPFKMADGLWYFEAVRLVGARKQVHRANALALCPLCAALFKHARHTKDEALVEQLAATAVEEGQGLVTLPVILNGRRVEIALTGRHAIDLKAALSVAGDARGSQG